MTRASAAAAEEFLFNEIRRKLTLADVDGDLSVLGLAVGEGHRESGNSALVGTQPLPGSPLSNIL